MAIIFETCPPGSLTSRPAIFQSIDQSIRDEHNKSMPSREELKENLKNMDTQCSYPQCGKILARSEAKLCARCKQVCHQKRVDGWRIRLILLTPRGLLLRSNMSEGTLVSSLLLCASGALVHVLFSGGQDTKRTAA